MSVSLKRKRNEFEDYDDFETLTRLNLCKHFFPFPEFDKDGLALFIGRMVKTDYDGEQARTLLDEVKALQKSNIHYRFDLRVCNGHYDVFTRTGCPVTVEDFVEVAQQYMDRVVMMCNLKLKYLAEESLGPGDSDEAMNELFLMYEKAEANMCEFMSCVWIRCGKKVHERTHDSERRRFSYNAYAVRTHLDVRSARVVRFCNIQQWRMSTFDYALIQENGRPKKRPTVSNEIVLLSKLWQEKTGLVTERTLKPVVCDVVASTNFNVWQQYEYRRHTVASACNFKDEWFVRVLLHIRYTWCDSSEQFAFVIGWMAFLVQRPDVRSHVMLGVLGEQGTGKSAVFALLRKIIGKAHSLETNTGRTFAGRFTAETDEKVYTHVDDAMCEESHSEVLKGLATGDDKRSERKGQDAGVLPNYNTFSFANNSTLPLSSDTRDRRLHCIHSRPSSWVTVNGTPGDTAQERVHNYTKCLFDKFEESESFLVFANFLYNVDLSVLMGGQPYDHTDAPPSVCADYIRFQRVKNVPLVNWWSESLEGEQSEGTWLSTSCDVFVNLRELRVRYGDWGGVKTQLTKASFDQHCMELMPAHSNTFRLPPLNERKRRFQERYPGYEYASSTKRQDEAKWLHIRGDNSDASCAPDASLVEQRTKLFLPPFLKYRNVATGDVMTLMEAIETQQFKVLNELQYAAKVKYYGL